eukprot:6375908-Karenia_brevis.AAC.1
MHLQAKHRHKEVAKVPTWALPCLQDIASDGEIGRTVRNYKMHAVAFYNEAVRSLHGAGEYSHHRCKFGSQNAFFDVQSSEQ